MRENILWFGLIFFIALSTILFFKQRQTTPAQPLATTTPVLSESWLSPVSLEHLTNDIGQPVSVKLPEKSVLILADMAQGCNACLFAEAEDWQKFINSDTGVEKETIALLCRSALPKQTKREFDALGVKYNVAFDTDGSLLKSLAVKRSPEVFFIYRSRVVCRYEADVSNRALTKTMQARFKEFMTLR
jgi:hypothetical protein